MEEQDLPAGWTSCSMEDLASYVTSGSRDWSKYYSSRGAFFVRTENINTNRLSPLEEIARVELPASVEGKRTLISKDDLLITITGANVGRCAHVDRAIPEAYVSQSVALVRLVEPSLAGFIHKQLLAPSADGKRTLLQESAYGIGRPVLSLADVRQVTIYLAPLDEQRRIAAKLDTTLAAVEACCQRLDGVAAILKRFRQAVLAAATSGELTREWREERGIEMDTWRGYEFSSLVREARTGLVRSAAEQHELQEGLVPYLKMDSIGESWGCSHDDLKGVRCEDAERSTYNLAYGDWLFNTRNSLELVGKSCVWEGPDGVVFNNNILRVRFTSTVRPQWIEIYLRSPGGRDMLTGVKSATTSVAAIYQRSLMALEIQAPSLDEQSEIIDRVESFFTLADQLEARLDTARKIVDRLTPALLAKAFRGELVPQDPNDEPASVLLEQIRAARQAEAAAGKPSRRGRRKAAAHPEQAPLPVAPAPPDLLDQLLQECGALSERALLAASELDPDHFLVQLELERASGAVRETCEDGQAVLEGA